MKRNGKAKANRHGKKCYTRTLLEPYIDGWEWYTYTHVLSAKNGMHYVLVANTALYCLIGRMRWFEKTVKIATKFATATTNQTQQTRMFAFFSSCIHSFSSWTCACVYVLRLFLFIYRYVFMHIHSEIRTHSDWHMDMDMSIET